jgi:microcystin-dependent protein
MSSPFLGEIVLFAGNFAPRSWAFCAGQVLAISQNTALFSILGTTYGGNGQTTFALPDLRSRVPVGQGQGPGLSSYSLGQQAGDESITLTVNEMPAHSHAATVACFNGDGNTGRSRGAFPADNSQSNTYNTTADNQMNPAMVQVGLAGGSQPHPNIQPYTTLNYIICVEGIFPSRN